jgi:cytidine deaminase
MDGFAAAFAPYRAVFSARVRTLLQYRTAALAGMSTQLFFGFVRVMIFTAFYQSSSAAQPMGYADAVTYIWLGQAMLMLIFLHVDPDVGEMIRTGTVAYELVRPVDLYGLWYCRAVTARLVPTLMRCTPILIVAGLFCGMGMPVSVGAALLCEGGEVFTGCNVENAAYGSSICAERTALVKAVSEGHRDDFARLAVVGNSKDYCWPCGACRQMLYEFAPGLELLVARADREFVRIPLSALLAHGFGPKSLETT